MNIGALGITAGVAAQSAAVRVSEQERTQHANTLANRAAAAEKLAEQAEGIGLTHEDPAAGDRDADGRLPWQLPAEGAPAEETAAESEFPTASDSSLSARRDPAGQAGTLLDLEG